MKNTPAWYEQKRPRTGTSRSHSPTDRTGALAEEGLVLKILFTLALHAREDLLLLVLFAISFSISKCCIFCRRLFQWFKAVDLIMKNCNSRKALEIVEIHRNTLDKSKSAIFALNSSGLNPCSYSFTSSTVRIPVHTATKNGAGTYPIGDDSLSRSTWRSFAPLQKPPRNQRYMCEQKPYPIWFSCRRKSYSL